MNKGVSLKCDRVRAATLAGHMQLQPLRHPLQH
jgi:hypothetical protein